MDTNSWILIALGFAVILGFYIKQFSFVVILFIVFVAIAVLFSNTSKSKTSTSPKGPLVQPIVIRRKYVGPATTYPEKIDIYEDKKSPSGWREYGPSGIGEFVGKGIKKIFDIFGEE